MALINTPWVKGYVPSAAEWEARWQSKLDGPLSLSVAPPIGDTTPNTGAFSSLLLGGASGVGLMESNSPGGMQLDGGLSGVAIVGGGPLVSNNGINITRTLAPATAALTPLFKFQGSLSGTTTSVIPAVIDIGNSGGDTMALTNLDSHALYFNLQYQFGGAAMTGHRSAMQIKSTLTAKTGNQVAMGPSSAPFYSGGSFNMQANVSEGGPDTSQNNSYGHLFAGASVVRTLVTATGFHEVTNWEFDMNTAAPSYKKFGVKVTQLATDIARGVLDGAFVVENGGDPALNGWHNGFLAVQPNANFPYAPDGCILSAPFSSDYVTDLNNMTRGIDLQETLFSAYAFRSRGFGVDGAGTLHVGNGYLAATADGVSLAASGSIGPAEGITISGANIVNGGTGGRVTGTVMYGPNGGVYSITGVAAGVVTQLTVLRTPYFASSTPPANPVSLIDNVTQTGNTTGTVQINQTWTQPNVLSLQPTGGLTSVGNTGVANYLQFTGGGGNAQTIQVAGVGTNGDLLLRSRALGQVRIGSTTGLDIAQFKAAATNGDTLTVQQPAAAGTAIIFDAVQGAASGGFSFLPRVVIGKAATLSNTSISPFWLNVGNNISGTQTGSLHQAMTTIVSNLDTLDTDGGVNILTVRDSLGAGWSGGRTPLNTIVTDIADTPFSANGHLMIGFGARAEQKFNHGGSATGYGVSAFGEGSVWGAVIQAVAFGTNGYYGGVAGMEIDVTVTAGQQILSENGLMIVHEGAHAVQGLNNSAALLISDQVASVAAWKNLIKFGNYDSKWPLDPNGYLIQVRSNGNPFPVGAGGIDLNQMTVAGTGQEGGGFFWRSPGMKIKDTEAQVGYGTLTNNASGLLIDATYKRMATAAGAITIAAGGANVGTGDIGVDAYGNTLVFTAVAGAATAVSTVITRGWQASPPADPVAVTLKTRASGIIGSGVTVNYGAWTAQTGITLGGSASKLGFYNATPIVKQTGVPVTIAGVHAALVLLGLIAA